jgi:peptidoglycan/xylan/chitin deacetylase (PgdA/CDA1 family)
MEMNQRGRTLKVIILILLLGVFTSMISQQKPQLFVVLSFDYEDLSPGIGTENIPEILDLLDRRDAKGSFFVMGKAAENDPEGVREIHKRGHSIGLHTYYHNFPIFNEEDAATVAEVYNTTPKSVWNKSFKTQEAFSRDMKANQKAIQDAAGVTPVMFRSPVLASTWDTSGEYVNTLKDAGIVIDSSVQQDWDNLRPFYYLDNGIIEIPLLMSEKRLDNLIVFKNYARRCMQEDIPLVMYIHPQNLDEDEINKIDDYLNALDEEYDVIYIRIEEVPDYF